MQFNEIDSSDNHTNTIRSVNRNRPIGALLVLAGRAHGTLELHQYYDFAKILTSADAVERCSNQFSIQLQFIVRGHSTVRTGQVATQHGRIRSSAGFGAIKL